MSDQFDHALRAICLNQLPQQVDAGVLRLITETGEFDIGFRQRAERARVVGIHGQ